MEYFISRCIWTIRCIFVLITVVSGTEYCVDDIFKAECPGNEVIIMTNATWGRMFIGRCVTTDFHLGCATDVLDIVDPWCSGKQSCEFPILNSDLRASTPCLKELQSFLVVEYQCIKVTDLDSSECTTYKDNEIGIVNGYLHSQTGDCGLQSNPWTIRAQPGQWVDLYLYDFSKPATRSGCEPLGYIIEGIVRNNVTICSGNNKRGSQIYSSVGSNLEIVKSYNHKDDITHNFFLRFQINGCPDPEITRHTWYKRDGNTVMLGCKEDDTTWTINCVDGAWVGTYRNCTTNSANEDQSIPEDIHSSSKMPTLPDKTWMVIIISLAVFVSFVVFLLGFVYIMRKRQSQQDSATSILQPLTKETIYKHNKEYAFMNDVPTNASYQTSNKSQAKPCLGSTMQPVVHASTCRRAQNQLASSTNGWSDSLPHTSYSNRGDIHQNNPVDGILLNQNIVSSNNSEYEIPYGSRHTESNVYNGMISAEIPTTENN